MLLLQCVIGYTAVLTLMETECEYKTAHTLLTLKTRLQPHVTFYMEKEMELAKLYAKCDDKGDVIFSDTGSFTFLDPTRAGEYTKSRTELQSVTIDEEFNIITCPPPPKISPVHLEALAPFINFS